MLKLISINLSTYSLFCPAKEQLPEFMVQGNRMKNSMNIAVVWIVFNKKFEE